MSTESTTTAAPGTTPSTDADAVILPLYTTGEFDPLDAFKVSFVIHESPATIVPPIWIVAVTVKTEAGKTVASFTIASGNKRTVNIPAVMPGALEGTMTFAVERGQTTFTCAYDLKHGGVLHPNSKTGTYTFAWK